MNQFGRGRLSSLLTWATLLLLALTAACEPAHAQNAQSSCIVTTRGGPDVLDVVFLMECSNMETVGVLHFDVQAVAGPCSSDRLVEVVFEMSPNSEGRSATVHRQSIQLKEGATSARGMMPFVMNSTNDNGQQRTLFWNVRVYEEGRDVERSRALQSNPGGPYVPLGLAADEPPPYMQHQRGAQNGSILHILDNGARFDTIRASRITPSYVQSAGGGADPVFETRTFDLARNFLRATNTRHVESLPEYWHYYLQFHAVTIDQRGLARLQAERPQAADAIRKYVAAGGDLIFVSQKEDAPRQIDQWLTNRENGHDPALWSADLKAFPSSTESYGDDELRLAKVTLDELSGSAEKRSC